jgi:hypothetical protein
MRESYGEGIADHTGPESCVGGREAAGEALTGAQAGPVLSRESKDYRIGTPTPLNLAEGENGRRDIASCGRVLRGQRPGACLETPRTGPGRSRVWRSPDGAAVRMANPFGARP